MDVVFRPAFSRPFARNTDAFQNGGGPCGSKSEFGGATRRVMSESGERAKEECFSEGQELVEVLSRSLLSLDEALADERDEPGLVNEAFRAVHTLKSLAGIFGAKPLANLSHRLEDALDEVRLG